MSKNGTTKPDEFSETVPEVRIRPCNQASINPKGEFVVYWMISYRRTGWNFSLQRAIEWARRLQKPLLVLEALRCDYPWASDRFHAFLLQGMAENARQFRKYSVFYYPFVELRRGAGKGLLTALGRKAAVVITDDFPAFFLPRMVAAAARNLPVLLERVDSNGLIPLSAADRCFSTAASFRRFLHLNLLPHLECLPRPEPLAGIKLPRLTSLPKAIERRWPPASDEMLSASPEALAQLPIDHRVGKAELPGGTAAAAVRLRGFWHDRIAHYTDLRHQPAGEAGSGLSPYLHFGHISSHQIFHELAKREKWSSPRINLRAVGHRSGWWGMSAPAEAFLDQLVTWRETGFNFCHHRQDYDRYRSLPDWAQKTLAKHADDLRPRVYALRQLESSSTHDALWNSIQRQLVREGRIPNYLRMLWGKKILEWSSGPQKALATMIQLNNKYALDGRDPNSYSGIFWCLGRYDRPWGPERSIFGTIRYMSSERTAQKLKLKGYMQRYAK